MTDREIWLSETVLPDLSRQDVLAIAQRVNQDPDTASDEDMDILAAYAVKFATEETRQ